MFGAKFVDLVYPTTPAARRLAAGAVLVRATSAPRSTRSSRTSSDLLHQIDPAKLNAVLTALAEGVRGQGERIGEATTDANQVLLALNPRMRHHPPGLALVQGLQRRLRRCGRTDILTILDAASTTSTTVTSHVKRRWTACCSTPSASPTAAPTCSRPNKDNLVAAINTLEPTTNLLLKYNPEYTCLLVGREVVPRQRRLLGVPGGNGTSLDRRRRPAARRRPLPLSRQPADRGGQGRPGRQARAAGRCPMPRRTSRCAQLVTNTGWGTGLDIRPNPGIGHPVLGRLLPGHPRPCRSRRASASASRDRRSGPSLPGGAALRRAAVRARRGAAVAGGAAGTGPAARAPAQPGPQRARPPPSTADADLHNSE